MGERWYKKQKNGVIFTKENIQAGQTVFFKYNLMEHGTLWGRGAYLGPDYTAEYLHQEGLAICSILSETLFQAPYEQLSSNRQLEIREKIPPILKQNRFDGTQNTLMYTPVEKAAFDRACIYWKSYFSEGLAPGLPKNYITSPEDAFNLTTFFSWASWAAVTNRPDEPFSYTNNFPYDPLVGNYPSSDAYFWSAMSLIFLLGAIGLMLFLFGKFDFLGWDPTRQPSAPSPPSNQSSFTKATSALAAPLSSLPGPMVST